MTSQISYTNDLTDPGDAHAYGAVVEFGFGVDLGFGVVAVVVVVVGVVADDVGEHVDGAGVVEQ
jgi:hypothetical protein